MRRFVLLLACYLLTGAVFAQSPAGSTEGRLNHEAFAKSSEMLPAMQSACKTLAADPTRSIAGINFAVRHLHDDITRVLKSKEDTPKARALVSAFERENGPGDAIPSVELHMLMAIVAHGEDNEQELIHQRAFHMAVLRAMGKSGTGEDHDHAWSPCFISNEYAMLRALGARQVKGQSLVHENERSYDVLDYVDASGKERKAWFDITDSFASEAKLFEKH